jgi:hypothetical protein
LKFLFSAENKNFTARRHIEANAKVANKRSKGAPKRHPAGLKPPVQPPVVIPPPPTDTRH